MLIITKGTNDQHLTSSAYVASVYAYVASENLLFMNITYSNSHVAPEVVLISTLKTLFVSTGVSLGF